MENVPTATADPTMTRINNYRYIEEANRSGIDLSKLGDRVSALEKENADLKKKMNEPKESPMSAELFAMQQAIVKDNPRVKEARERLAHVREEAIAQLLYADHPAYKMAHDTFTNAVNAAYMEHVKGSGYVGPTTGTEIKTTE